MAEFVINLLSPLDFRRLKMKTDETQEKVPQDEKKFWRKPLDFDEWKKPKGELIILEDRCKGCKFCIEFCPNEVLAESPKLNAKGYHPPEISKPDECVGCGLCERICPEFAIIAEKILEEV